MRGRLAYDISQGLTTGINISYDEAFDTRVSADLSVRFGGPNTTVAKKKKWENLAINALSAFPKNRDVRVHDACWVSLDDPDDYGCSDNTIGGGGSGWFSSMDQYLK